MAAAMISTMVVIAIGGAHVGAAVVWRHRAQSAADLAALAGAADLVWGVDAACGRASLLANAMRAVVVACAQDRLDLFVTVESQTTSRLLSAMGPARAVAKAGPADLAIKAPP